MPNLNHADTLKGEDLTIMRLFDNIKNNFNKLNQGSKLHPDVSIYLPDYEVETPFFTYKIDSRETSEQTGYKPRHVDTDYENKVKYLGQMYRSEIEFAVYGKNYKRVNEERSWFEEFMQKEKKNVSQYIVKFFFIEQDNDEVVEANEDTYIKQTLKYHLVHQRIYALPFELIEFESIETQLSKSESEAYLPEDKDADNQFMPKY